MAVRTHWSSPLPLHKPESLAEVFLYFRLMRIAAGSQERQSFIANRRSRITACDISVRLREAREPGGFRKSCGILAGKRHDLRKLRRFTDLPACFPRKRRFQAVADCGAETPAQSPEKFPGFLTCAGRVDRIPPNCNFITGRC